MSDQQGIKPALLLELASNALKNHPWSTGWLERLKVYVRRDFGRALITDVAKLRWTFACATRWSPVGCEDAPSGATGKPEDHAAYAAHWHTCDECQEIAEMRRDLERRVVGALIHYMNTGQATVPDTADEIPGPEDGILIHCSACGAQFRAQRINTRTCTDKCRQALHRQRRQQQAE